ncbi:hypothetical protein ACLMJK_006469 [Lecanora helva]
MSIIPMEVTDQISQIIPPAMTDADPPPSTPPPPAARPSRPVSEALLNDKVPISFFDISTLAQKPDVPILYHQSQQPLPPHPTPTYLIQLPQLILLFLPQWDHAISTTLIRSALGFSFGAIFSVLLFKRRAWPVIFGTGFGAGRGYEDADGMRLIKPG